MYEYDSTDYDILTTRVDDIPPLLDDMRAIAWIETHSGKRVKSVEWMDDPLNGHLVTFENGTWTVMDACDELLVAWLS